MSHELTRGLATVLAGLACAAQARVTFLNFNMAQPSSTVFNDRIGNSRLFGGPNTDRARGSTFMRPSPDSDVFVATNAQGLEFTSLNGDATGVTVTHANFGTLAKPRRVTFGCQTPGLGSGRNEFVMAMDGVNPAATPQPHVWSGARLLVFPPRKH